MLGHLSQLRSHRIVVAVLPACCREVCLQLLLLVEGEGALLKREIELRLLVRHLRRVGLLQLLDLALQRCGTRLQELFVGLLLLRLALQLEDLLALRLQVGARINRHAGARRALQLHCEPLLQLLDGAGLLRSFGGCRILCLCGRLRRLRRRRLGLGVRLGLRLEAVVVLGLRSGAVLDRRLWRLGGGSLSGAVLDWRLWRHALRCGRSRRRRAAVPRAALGRHRRAERRQGRAHRR